LAALDVAEVEGGIIPPVVVVIGIIALGACIGALAYRAGYNLMPSGR
jgi:hypothetical protein